MFFCHWRATVLFLLCLTSWAAAPTRAEAATLRIMPLGDSITYGGDNTAGYRGPLYHKLTAAGYDVLYVGSETKNAGTLPAYQLPAGQVHHEGHSGSMIDSGTPSTGWRDGLSNHINTWLGTNGVDPDIILLMIGTNDMYEDYQRGTAAERLSNLISTISDKKTGLKPNAKLIVAQITPQTDAIKDAWVREYNTSLVSVVATHRARDENVSTVDMHSALNPAADLEQIYGVHPIDSGYIKMADVWAQGIAAVVPEPSQSMSMATGLATLLAYAWRIRK